MACSSAPKIQTYKVDSAIANGKAVKFGSDEDHVAVCTAASDKSIGVAQVAASAAEQFIEVALNGGGGKGLAQGTIAAGDPLTSHTDGSLKVASSGERVVAFAMGAAVAADIFSLEVSLSKLP